MSLVEITEKDYPVSLELRYATPHNFTGQKIYERPLCFLHEKVLPLFERAINLADQQNLRFKIFDAFRPQTAQEKLWAICPNPMYVSPPQQGSNHTRGVAIDLTLIDDKGEELDMGTPFDDFTPHSHHGASIHAAANANRYLLLGIMMSAGWDLYPTEWWHYQAKEAEKFPLIHSDHAMML